MRLKDYEILYDLPAGEYDETAVGGIRTRTIRAGDTLEVECYPIARVIYEKRAEARQKRTPLAMARLNQRNTQRRMARLIDQNFTPADYVFTGTYAYPAEDMGFASIDGMQDLYLRDGLPWEIDRVKRDVVNFIQRVKRRVKRRGGDPKAVKYLYVVESGRDPGNGLPPRFHWHGVIHAPGLTSDELKALWDRGFTRCDRLDLEHGGADRLSKYLTKQRRYERTWGHSRNLKEPDIRTSDRKVSRRRAALVARDVMQYGRQVFEAIYPGYRCEEPVEVHFSDIVPGAYIYARLRRRR